jgi:hypothetical protein
MKIENINQEDEGHFSFFCGGVKYLIDESDIHFLNEYSWRPQNRFNYLNARTPMINTVRKGVSLHRLIMGDPAGCLVDHINRDPCDNRRCNLRKVTRSQNAMNKKTDVRSLSKLKGVRYRYGSYSVEIRIAGKKTHIGCFSTKEEAFTEYQKASFLHHGEYGNDGVSSNKTKYVGGEL